MSAFDGSRQLFNNVTTLLKTLFEREEAHLTKRENAILAKHRELGGSSDGFRHLGLIYTDLSGAAKSRGSYDRLYPSLVPELDNLLAERQTLANDRDRIRQAFVLTLRDCQTPQDMRDALPNSVKDLMPTIKNLPRTRPEAFTLAENPRSYNQYMKLREKIDYYVAARLLY